MVIGIENIAFVELVGHSVLPVAFQRFNFLIGYFFAVLLCVTCSISLFIWKYSLDVVVIINKR